MQKGINNESIDLLLYITKKEKELRRGGVKPADPDRLGELFYSYKTKLLRQREKDRYEAETALRTVLMINPSNKRFMQYCLKRGLFYNLASVVRCYTETEEEALTDDLIRSFTEKLKDKDQSILLPVLCQTGPVLSENMKAKLGARIIAEPDKCTLQGLYYALSDCLVKLTPVLSEYFMKLILNTSEEKLREPVYDNPMYTLLKLYKEGSLPSFERFVGLTKDERIIKMAFFPEKLEAEDFDPYWWKILSVQDCKKMLSRPDPDELFDRMMSVKDRSFCPVKNRICTVRRDLAYRRIRNMKESPYST